MGKYPKIFLHFVYKMTCKFSPEYYNIFGDVSPFYYFDNDNLMIN